MGARMRWGLAGGVLASWVVLALWAGLDLARGAAERAEADAAALDDLVRVANAALLQREALLDADLEQLRLRLRTEAVWAAGATPPEAGEVAEGGEADRRRRDAVLRNALAEAPDLLAFELVVAGHRGLQHVRYEPTPTGVVVSAADAEGAEGVAKALWYADEVQRAVAAAGRGVEHAEPEDAQGGASPTLRRVIALHAPGELVQGVLVATIDPGRAYAPVAALAPRGRALAVVDHAGRLLATSDGWAGDELGVARAAAWTARVIDGEGPPRVFQSDGRWVLGRPIARSDGTPASILLLAETGAGPTGLAALRSSVWPGVLAAQLVAGALALFALFAPGGAAGGRRGEAESAQQADGGEQDGLSSGPFDLRAWLADVRSCLEREAAKRGLGLVVRCDRALPEEIRGDAGWLGGLLVALGREALDATGDDRVVLDVYADEARTLCFALDAGGAALGPVPAMESLAASLEARFEQTREGRLALVVPGAMA